LFLIDSIPPHPSAAFINGKALLSIRSGSQNNMSDDVIIFVVNDDYDDDYAVQIVSSDTGYGIHFEDSRFDS
jgi:hypothetical protein